MNIEQATAEKQLREIRYEAGVLIWAQHAIGNLLGYRTPEFLTSELVGLLREESNKTMKRLFTIQSEELDLLKILGRVCGKCGFTFQLQEKVFVDDNGRKWHSECLPKDRWLFMEVIEINYEPLSPKEDVVETEAQLNENKTDANNPKSV